ncbi:SigE family RNA polymerase sigma factor [Streptomyces lunaelactis]|uniref:SigE family RNA polymerase sigma factor n=1 Tax=Streptomyces lunaelactis TaxID=1535768 RepID=UPI001584CAAF|nr:SigE family RNA polymerase sigma factor [Streptomyces lunaelactis]NUK02866.1 SigE family RNA polymerase sigma factor [Streptomyces lunaelactis]NUK07962.1 SigE family RNA polymerase sigma factor [Streptomyces lunaelactis]NUK17021.1 SigE family RNA polymerase sigma factor [Streptomyces lunaelactis]NUK24457.1 SigE family RNA polymerase sigma factor [Streptomyces lunaelactis]NUK36127.1 SigE family RNA polymerase sigma factor [Streptomyces lunaelactis]
MNALHSTNPSAVVTRLHDVVRSTEKSGAVNGRGCVRSAGRQHKPSSAEQGRKPYMTVVDATVGGGGAAYGEATGDRTSLSEAEFTAYVQERRASLYATAYHLTGDRFEAEDLLQSALFSTYRAWDRISDKAAVGGYLRRTMTNLHISAWRRRKLNEYPTEELPETASDTDAMRGTELRAVLWQALARLPELQRTMLVLRYYEGRTDPEIAEILDISVGTVKSSIWRSLRRLREDEVLSFGRDEEESFGELVA